MARNDEYCCCPWTAASFPGVSALARIRSTYMNRPRPWKKITTRMERSFAYCLESGLALFHKAGHTLDTKGSCMARDTSPEAQANPGARALGPTLISHCCLDVPIFRTIFTRK